MTEVWHYIQAANREIAEFTIEYPTMVGSATIVASVAAVALAIFSGISVLTVFGVALAAAGIYAVVISIQHLRESRNEQNDQLNEQIGPLAQQVVEQRETLDGQVELIQNLTTQNETLQQQLKFPVNSEHQEIENQNQAYRITELTDQLREKNLCTEEKNLEIEELTKQFVESKKVVEELQKDKSVLQELLKKQNLNQLEQKGAEQLQEQLKVAKSNLQMLQKQLDKSGAELLQLKKENTHFHVQWKAAEEDKRKLEEELKKADTTNVQNLERQLCEKTEELAAQIQKAEEALRRKNTRITDQTKRIEELAAIVLQLSNGN